MTSDWYFKVEKNRNIYSDLRSLDLIFKWTLK